MKLTEENLDYMDCRPLGRETGIAPDPELEARLAPLKAKRLETMAATSAKRMAPKPPAAE